MIAAVSTTALVAGLGVAGAALAQPALAAEQGSLEAGQVSDSAAGPIDYTVYLPPGYDDEPDRAYPTVYLLHGRGDTQAAWQQVKGDLDELIVAGDIQPLVVVMPDAPWNDRGSWYTDSLYTGDDAPGTGVPVETALTQDLVAHVDATYRTVPDRAARAVGGYSMGGAGALRFTLAHQDTFSAGIVLSPAAYVPQPPADSSVRDHGAYGVGDALFDADRYTELSYPTALADLDPALPVHLFIVVGDDEWANPDPADATHDIDFESARLYNTARRVPGVTAELRVLDGGHDWEVWQPAFREAIVDVAGRLRTEPVEPWEADLVGSAGDDRAGGIAALPDGGTALAVNLAAAWEGYEPAGATDTLVVRRDADGDEIWRHAVATTADDRAYGVVPGPDGGTIAAGYTRGDLDGQHGGTTHDDGYVVGLTADGDRAWTVQTGDPAAADRFYAVASDGEGGAYVAGYTSGAIGDTPSAGDKDAVLGRVAADGTLRWLRQLGGAGEDKALAVAVAPDGAVYVGGVSGAGMPGTEHRGANDGWVARYTSGGEREWLRALATSESDQVSGLVARSDGSAVAIGHTRGTLGVEAAGDNDVVARAFDRAGDVLWTTQTGTATDDRGVAGVLGVDDQVLLVGTTYGAMGIARGGVDVVTLPLGKDGSAGAVTQLGSRERDGADEWDDANLFAVGASPSGGDGASFALLSGLTYGSPDLASGAGAGDVFVSRVPWEAAPGGPGGDGEIADLVTVTAQSRCLAGRVVVAVRAESTGTIPVDLMIRTDLGEHSAPGVQPGANAYQSFSSRAVSIPAGDVSVSVARAGGAPSGTVMASYPERECG
ncbi:esterase [Cellulosimicrobium arenosum]|uniref:Esterase n=1 Tax=Cellulosimicrobium arenosum TaxID=2708133 RepID=A0A927G8Q6_9MICO|nr:alpha/beta hydrolase-fold protein [Cellulosimicrobium arenosum]MBD8078619.1 esterase [Cellulosimicrobium arenosum]